MLTRSLDVTCTVLATSMKVQPQSHLPRAHVGDAYWNLLGN